MPDYPVPAIDDVELVEVMRALADPIRLHIARILADGEPHGKTMEDWGVDVTKSTMSHHFRTLREAGLTRTIIDGRTHAIQLRRDELDVRFPGLIAAVTQA
ncbi:helix-turn-helix domain-containing protein [Curtobacterium sp. MCBD17_003]|uniref:ArsR/SmtB family transcription factor n=1 Tax=Curtobacterium sp. MCBD17_003 TaxID=2175667 RepID=UPI000DA89B9B|nr:helix-turn-helix domain-containing protein [Curtobacterium sp. MCBD17_003]WIE55680.1 helix-turn-helix domain-containing protein [Curtobacterium sp. MCBD17_003]